MTIFVALSAAVLGVLGALAIYVLSPNQRLLARRPDRKTAAGAGLGLLAIAAVLLQRVMGPAAAIYAVFMLAMTVWTGAPFVLTFGKRARG